jgi:predicted aminopeptidase
MTGGLLCRINVGVPAALVSPEGLHMDKIEDIDLPELVAESSQQFLQERRASVTGLIKQMFQRAEQLANEIRADEKGLAKKRGKLSEVTAKIEKLRGGDWSVLQQQGGGDGQN